MWLVLVGREGIVAAGEAVALEEVELLEVARFVSQVEGGHVSG
jgi:hypothetical protein